MFWRRVRNERGSAAVEAALGVPAFVLFVGLIIFGGRTATTHSAVESAAAVYDLDPDDVLPAALVAVRGLVEDGLLTLD